MDWVCFIAEFTLFSSAKSIIEVRAKSIRVIPFKWMFYVIWNTAVLSIPMIIDIDGSKLTSNTSNSRNMHLTKLNLCFFFVSFTIAQDWTLQIRYVQFRDAGWYECQLSIHPPVSIFIKLIVVGEYILFLYYKKLHILCLSVSRILHCPYFLFSFILLKTIFSCPFPEARAEILGGPIKYLTPNSTLRLSCRVVENSEMPEFIFWYHDDRMINYDLDRGINVSTRAGNQCVHLYDMISAKVPIRSSVSVWNRCVICAVVSLFVIAETDIYEWAVLPWFDAYNSATTSTTFSLQISVFQSWL